jgi:hypothetical protein
MNTLFIVSKAGELDTRLNLPDAAWADRMREKLSEMGYSVQDTTRDAELCMRDVRDEWEQQREDYLFDLCAPL